MHLALIMVDADARIPLRFASMGRVILVGKDTVCLRYAEIGSLGD